MRSLKYLAMGGMFGLAIIAGTACSSSQNSSASARQGDNGAETTARHRLSPDEETGFQGGNGAFGESPESPGSYAPSSRNHGK